MRTDAELQKLRNHAKKHWLDGWSIKRSAGTLELPPVTVSRWRRHWAAGEELRTTGRPKGSYLGRNLRGPEALGKKEERHKRLRAEARKIIDNMKLPEPVLVLVRELAGRRETARRILDHAAVVNFDPKLTRRLLDILVTVKNPWATRIPKYPEGTTEMRRQRAQSSLRLEPAKQR